ncbi:MAG: tRNA epoxyqueuosine(34) reductase QueG [Thioalkalispiraceae bacterium]
MNNSPTNLNELVKKIHLWAKQLGFQQIGISDTDLSEAEIRLIEWLDQDFHGEMAWMLRHGSKRSRPAELHPGTLRIISARMDYWPAASRDAWEIINDSEKAFVSRYALGRDYHKLLRRRLQQLASMISAEVGEFGYRVFVDSAPVMEKPIAEKAGLGWIGKHTNLINREAGSWFFLGEIYTDLPLPSKPTQSENHCGTCSACIEACPTDAIVGPYQLDARRCISYLTIEHRGSFPEELRKKMGNRIYGCDDCQLVCPWNRFSKASNEKDFLPRHQLDDVSLLELFSWDQQQFEQQMQGSPIRRIGYEAWIRNIVIALGNSLAAMSQTDKSNAEKIIGRLKTRSGDKSSLIREHVEWALKQYPG